MNLETRRNVLPDESHTDQYLKALETENSTMKRQMAKLQANLDSYLNKLQKMQQEIAEKESARQEQQKKAEAFQNEALVLMKKLEECSEALGTCTKDYKALQQKSEVYKNQFSELRENYEGDIMALRKKVGDYEREIPVLRKKAEAYDKEIPGLRKKAEAYDQEIPSLREKAEAYDKEIPGLRKKVEAYDKEAPGLREKAEAYSKETPELRKKVDVYVKQSAEQRETIRKTKKKFKVCSILLILLSICACAASTYFYFASENNRSEVYSLEQRISSLGKELEGAKDSYSTLEEENSALQIEVTALEEEKSELEKDGVSLKKDIEKLSSNYQSLEEAYEGIKPEYDFYHQYAVIVSMAHSQSAERYHHYDCTDLDTSLFLIFNINAAKEDYEPCPVCIK